MPVSLELLVASLPALVAAGLVVLTLVVADRLLLRRGDLTTEARLPRQLIMVVTTAVGLVVIVIVLPITDDTQGQLLGLLGVLVSAVLALSATTFVANAMGGLMLRSIRSYRPGDFISVGGHFGRVTERGLFHTEIQTEDRDLETLPNLYLVTNPVRVVRASGTIVSAKVSLGYDAAHDVIEPLLVRAAGNAGLDDPFVQVLELGDFAVTFRIAGFLPQVKQLLTARSELRRAMLDALHEGGVEILSPTFMVQRPQAESAVVVPGRRKHRRPATGATTPEDMIFDKADQKERLGHLAVERKVIEDGIKSLQAEAKEGGDAAPWIERRITIGRQRLEELDAEAAALEADSNDDAPPAAPD